MRRTGERVETIDEIRARVIVTESGCWDWQGLCNPTGYGQAQDPVHRMAWHFANGPIPLGLVIAHKCDRPPCCNPAHLFLTTPNGNTMDMYGKGRNGTRSRKGKVRRNAAHQYRGHVVSQARKARGRFAALVVILGRLAGMDSAEAAKCEPEYFTGCAMPLGWRWDLSDDSAVLEYLAARMFWPESLDGATTYSEWIAMQSAGMLEW